MRPVTIIGVCLVALCAAMAAVAASASAETLPAVYECAKAPKEKAPGKNYEGHYTGKKCEASTYSEVFTTKTKYELQPWSLSAKKGVAKEFKDTKGGGSRLYIVGVGGVTCTKNTDTGYFTGPKTVGKIKVIFSGCELNGHKCQGETPQASKSGEVITNALTGEIGYINKAKKEVGVLLKPEPPEEYFAEFNCAELNFRTGGGVIGKVTSAENAFTKSVTLLYAQEEGRQEPESFEGGATEHLLTGIGEVGSKSFGESDRAGEATTATNTGEELELVA